MQKKAKRIIALILVNLLFFVTTAYGYTYPADPNATTGCATFYGIFLSDENHTDYWSSSTTDTAVNSRELKAGVTDDSNVVLTAPDTYKGMDQTGVDLQPVFEIKFNKNIIGKSPAFYNFSINKDKVSIVRADNGDPVGVNVTNNASVNSCLFIQPIENLDSNTLYKIIVNPGIINGSTVPYPATAYSYIGEFMTQAPAAQEWTDGSAIRVNNLLQNSLTLIWPATDPTALPADSFQILQGATEIGRTSSLSYDVSGLTSDSNYTFTVNAMDKDGKVLGSLTANTKTKPDGPLDITLPTWVNNLNHTINLTTSNITTDSVTLNWAGSEVSDDDCVTGYKVLNGDQVVAAVDDGSAASCTVKGLNLGTTYTLKVEARDATGNWSTDGPQVKFTTAYLVGTKVPMTGMAPISIDGGVTILPKQLTAAAHTVTVRDAAGEVPYNKSSDERPVEWSMLYYGDLKSAGGVYGFNFKTDNGSDGDTVSITLPVTDKVNLAAGKVKVYRLDWFYEDPFRLFITHRWDMLDTKVDKVNNTVTVDIRGCDQDVILGVFSDNFGPEAAQITNMGKTDKPSTYFTVDCSSDSGLGQVIVNRKNLITGESKDITITQNITHTGDLTDYRCYYEDTDVQDGGFYSYKVTSIKDTLGNEALVCNASGIHYCGSDTAAVANLKQYILANPFTFLTEGDSQSSVTGDFSLNVGPYPGSVTWSSDNTSVISVTGFIISNLAGVHQPENQDAVVNLTANISIGTATDTLMIPVTVKQMSSLMAQDISNIDAAIIAGDSANTLQALKAASVGLTGIIDSNAADYQSALAAARTAKGSALTQNELQGIVTNTNDKVDIDKTKAQLIADGLNKIDNSTGTIDTPSYSNLNGVKSVWTAVSGTDAYRVTIANERATLNSIPYYTEPAGSITLTLTMTKGATQDTLVYTYSLGGYRTTSRFPWGIITTPTVSMSSDQVTAQLNDQWVLEIAQPIWADGTTLKPVLNKEDVAVTGLPEGMDYTVNNTGNTIYVTPVGTAAAPVTSPASISIVVKSSAVTQTAESDSTSFTATLNPFSTNVILDYTPGVMGSPLLDSWIPENQHWKEFMKAAQNDGVQTVTLNKSTYMYSTWDSGEKINYDVDMHGKTIIAGQDMDFLFASNSDQMYFGYNISGPVTVPRGRVVTLKNAVIDMNHKNVKTIFNAKGIIHLENVKIINAENTSYGAMVWANNTEPTYCGDMMDEHFIADNCQFGSFKIAAVLQWTPFFIGSEMQKANALTSQVKLTNSTFDGGGQPGFGVVGTYGSLVIENCIFKNYKGNVATGVTPSTDRYNLKINLAEECTSILSYKGIPDGTSSAAILLKEVSAAKVNGNTITDCDNGVQVWNHEQIWRHDDQIPPYGYAGYVTINGTALSGQVNGVYDYLTNNNAITIAAGSNGATVAILDASDRYNRSVIMESNNETTVTSAPSIGLAALAGTTLVLEGLPANAANLEYRTAYDGTNYNDWKDLLVSGTNAIIDGTGLTAGTSKVQIRVKTIGWAEVSTVTVGTLLSKPASVKAASASYNSIKVSWGAAAGASGYQVYRAASSTGTYSLIATTTSLSYINSGLTTNSTYYYKVRAYKVIGTAKVYSGYSTVVSTKPILSVPASVKAASASYNSIKVSWGAAAGASGYQVYRATSSTGTYSLITTTTSLSCISSGLTTGKTYYYKIRAYRTVGTIKVYSGYSTIVNTKAILSAPVNLKAVRYSSTSIKLTWSGAAGASGYVVYRATSSTGTYSLIKTTSYLSYTNTGLTRYRTYYYKIRAYRTVGTTRIYSNWATVVSAKPY